MFDSPEAARAALANAYRQYKIELTQRWQRRGCCGATPALLDVSAILRIGVSERRVRPRAARDGAASNLENAFLFLCTRQKPARNISIAEGLAGDRWISADDFADARESGHAFAIHLGEIFRGIVRNTLVELHDLFNGVNQRVAIDT